MLVTLDDLAARLVFDMDADEQREAEGALEDLTFDAQAYGSAAWTTPENTPQAVKNLILRAAARHMKNYEGYTMSRAGDETTQWTDRGESAGTATFTDDEKKMLARMGGNLPGFGSIGVTAWGASDRSRVGFVPVSYPGGKTFPLFADEQEPW